MSTLQDPRSTAVRPGDAYLRVRVTKQARADGTITVYLPSGTGLDVRADDLATTSEITRGAR